jgi:hypothetical protein
LKLRSPVTFEHHITCPLNGWDMICPWCSANFSGCFPCLGSWGEAASIMGFAHNSHPLERLRSTWVVWFASPEFPWAMFPSHLSLVIEEALNSWLYLRVPSGPWKSTGPSWKRGVRVQAAIWLMPFCPYFSSSAFSHLAATWHPA